MTGAIRRVVLMTVTADDHAAQVVASAHRSLASIGGVECLVAAEPLEVVRGDASWTHVTVLQFLDEAALDAYVVHPDHLRIQPIIDRYTRATTVLQTAPETGRRPRDPGRTEHEPDVVRT